MEKLDNFFEGLQTTLTDEYISTSRIMSIIIGIIACALFIFTAVSTRRSTVFGIIAGVLNGFSMYVAHCLIVLFHRIDFIFYETIYGPADQISDLVAKAESEYWANTLPDLILFILCMLFINIAWVTALIYMIRLLKIKPKILTVFALFIHIIGYIFIFPINIISPLVAGEMTVAMQETQDIIYHISVLTPIILFSICALMHIVNSKKGSPDATQTEE